ncbi:alpha/beta fold hydrolase [Galactobacter caseinivorans]|uniref:Alpha/beta hydrolase n=1 Tax=Galactobacter caseinivorans TaxID=2676123 RepID=A0A496PGM9_9MICC|nr:alpha/beta hydrolase [Galactobacter caseinivorans]RKW69638.1 alpha/beta hydrolase [Galactobacter caseinivorans]
MSDSTTRTIPTSEGGQLHLVTHGPADAAGKNRIVIVCGAFLPAVIYAPFAHGIMKDLGDEWAVDVYDRRGKGKSSDIPDNYSMDTEIADVAAVLKATGARHLLGHSLGGSVTLNAVQAFAGLDINDRHFHDPALVPERTAVYDPAINVEGSNDATWLPEFERLVNEGKLARALALANSKFGNTPTLSKAPNFMVAGVLALSLRTGLGAVGKGVFPAAVAELKAALGEEAAAKDFADLPTKTLFMTGENSSTYFQTTTRRLAKAVPGSTLEIAPKGMHGSVPAVRHDVVSGLAAWFSGEEAPDDVRVES